MNVKKRYMTVIGQPLVQMNVVHIHVSVTLVSLEMAFRHAITLLPALRYEYMAVL